MLPDERIAIDRSRGSWRATSFLSGCARMERTRFSPVNIGGSELRLIFNDERFFFPSGGPSHIRPIEIQVGASGAIYLELQLSDRTIVALIGGG